MLRILAIIVAALSAASTTVSADEPGEPRRLVEAAIAAHGGDAWLSPGTLALSGEAVFYSPDGIAPRSRADEYGMWREMNPDRTSAHGAEGKVRIVARSGEKILFEVGYDGETTWTEKGVLPKAEADALWASNFGFGIIRTAIGSGLEIQAAPQRNIDGHAIDLVRIVDPQGQATLFGFDRDSHFIRYLGFRTPRGWHERIYDDFIKLPDSGWVQARRVTLFYDGVKANEVLWTSVETGQQLGPEIFSVPLELRHILGTQ